MTISLALSLLIMILGLLLYWYAVNEKKKEIGRIAFAAGLLASLFLLHGGVHLTLFQQ